MTEIMRKRRIIEWRKKIVVAAVINDFYNALALKRLYFGGNWNATVFAMTTHKGFNINQSLKQNIPSNTKKYSPFVHIFEVSFSYAETDFIKY